MANSRFRNTFSWPKILPELSPEQAQISNDFMRFWHERLAENPAFGPIERFNHGFSVRNRPRSFLRTLEIGAGLGEHLDYEVLTPEQKANYYALEIRPNMLEKLQLRHPEVIGMLADCQKTLDFRDGFFDRILAIHVLEHLSDLPAAVNQLARVLSPSGQMSVVIPCEGGFLYSIARRLSAQRLFERRYKTSYDWFIEREHLSVPAEIEAVLLEKFEIKKRSYFPFFLPSVHFNLCIGLVLTPR